jgi:hypothetical protein
MVANKYHSHFLVLYLNFGKQRRMFSSLFLPEHNDTFITDWKRAIGPLKSWKNPENQKTSYYTGTEIY